MTAPVRRNRPAHSCACGLHSCFRVIAPASPEVLLIVACAAAEGDYRPGAIPVTEVLGLLSGICLEGAPSARLPPAPIAANQGMKLFFLCASMSLCKYWVCSRPLLSTLPHCLEKPLMGRVHIDQDAPHLAILVAAGAPHLAAPAADGGSSIPGGPNVGFR